MTTREQAAQERLHQIRNPADRPRERRCAESAGAPPLATFRAQIELREAATSGGLTFEGYASAYEQAYEMYDFWGPYTEVVSAGAGAESLARADLDVPLVLQHQQLRRIARTTNGSLVLSEDEQGLRVLAENLDPEDQDVAYIAPKLRSGLIDEMSFAFRIVRGLWSPDYSEYRITRYDIHRGDVSIVGYGANPFTSGTLRAAGASRRERSRDEALLAFQ